VALHRKLIEDLRPVLLSPIYARPGEAIRAPRHTLPEQEMDPDTAYQFVRDELMLDGNARLNLATFVTTWMEPQAVRLMSETFDRWRRSTTTSCASASTATAPSSRRLATWPATPPTASPSSARSGC
jgi:glutamate/tyrosine decarboxylase-like PLP-dependent enzyme